MVTPGTAANALPAGDYAGTVSFLNTTTGNGNALRSATLTVSNFPTVTLNLTATPPAWGGVSPANGSYRLGTNIQLLATPASYYQFSAWTGDVASPSNPLPVILNSNLTAQAVFAEILTTNHPTPHAWLAANGYTNDFENAVTTVGANGYLLWQSYVAGLDPNNAASQLLLAGAVGTESNSFVLGWNTVTGRVYSIWSATNPAAGFAPLAGATNLPWTVTGVTNVIDPGTGSEFFRLEVQKP